MVNGIRKSLGDIRMTKIHIKIGEQLFEIHVKSERVENFIVHNFKTVEDGNLQPDVKIELLDGYGSPFVDYEVTITKESDKIIFRRSDYLIEAVPDYKSACIFVNNALALKHALMNLYSSFIVYHNWGLLIHSSCAVENGNAHIFAGQSGAGKSTAARLSHPRDLLSDEATLIKITSDEINVFNSPFRSEIITTGTKDCVPLASIQVLHQALQNNRLDLRKAEAFVHLMDKIFYWSHNPEETKKITVLLKMLVDIVPAYELYFKKDDTFWELIS
jgi:hypothetical protein